MNPTFQYHFGALATSHQLSPQAAELRELLFSYTANKQLFSAVKDFVIRQMEIDVDTEKLLNIAIMPAYGSEYLGLGGADWNLKADFLKSLVARFTKVVSFKFQYADCACMAGLPVEEFYSILEEGMVLDKANKYYPSNELFQAIKGSKFDFQFDLLLLDKYRQPCSKNEFEKYVDELREQYKTVNQVEQLNGLRWGGHNTSG